LVIFRIPNYLYKVLIKCVCIKFTQKKVIYTFSNVYGYYDSELVCFLI